MLWLLWMSQVPVLAITQFSPEVHEAMSPAVQVVVPLVSRRRPLQRFLTAPERVSSPLNVVVPAGGVPTPAMVPPLQVEAPVAVTVSEPPSWPADWVSVVMLIGSPLLKLTVPPVTVRVVPTLVTVAAALKVTVPLPTLVCVPTLYVPLMLTTLEMMGNVTVGAAIDEPVSSVAAPPKRSVVPADPVKEPVLAPPPSSPSVPPDTVMSTTLPLFTAAKIEVAPVPAVLRRVPLL